MIAGCSQPRDRPCGLPQAIAPRCRGNPVRARPDCARAQSIPDGAQPVAHRDRAARRPIANRIHPDAGTRRLRASAAASRAGTTGLCASGNGLRACACRPRPGDRARIASAYGPRASRLRLPPGARGQVPSRWGGLHRQRGRFTSLRWIPGRAKRCQAPRRTQPGPALDPVLRPRSDFGLYEPWGAAGRSSGAPCRQQSHPGSYPGLADRKQGKQGARDIYAGMGEKRRQSPFEATPHARVTLSSTNILPRRPKGPSLTGASSARAR